MSLLALLAGMGQVAAQEPNGRQVESERILVVGAGFAGLTAARLLHDSGFDVVVLEARDRIGGRAWTLDLAGVPVEMGAMFVHGTVGSPVIEAADSLGVQFRPRASDLSLGWDTRLGRALTDEERLSVLIIAGAFAGRSAELERELGEDASVAQAIDRFLELRGVQGAERRLLEFGLEQLMMELYDSGPVDRTALEHTGVYEELAGGDQVIAGGYRELAQRLAEGLEIRLETRVSKIAYGDEGVTVSTTSGDVVGDRVLVTVSQGVLESGAITFEPPLPAERLAAIERLDMANLEKVVFVFETAFWRETPERSRSLIYVGDPVGELPACLDFSDHVGKPTLTCLYGGGSARRALENQTIEAIETNALAILREVFGDRVPEPTAVVSSAWWLDPLTLGSYSYLAVGADPADMRLIGQPVGRRLFFAGEATVPEYYGTVHAAMLSGIREAIRLGATGTTVQGLCGRLPDCRER